MNIHNYPRQESVKTIQIGNHPVHLIDNATLTKDEREEMSRMLVWNAICGERCQICEETFTQDDIDTVVVGYEGGGIHKACWEKRKIEN